ncbi:N-acetyltransferase family protein [Streptomyces sp. B6B3]|uniref:GNAT family N-acetyltransferase n=1 Tax=Streptomyces sp. B6B3 TaxID=3153570 RepID=UPI00325DAB98
MSHAISVRPATADDLPAVADIFLGYVVGSVSTFEESPPGVATWRQKLDDLTERGLPFLVAEATVAEPGGGSDAGGVVGFAYAGPWRPKPAYRHTAEDSIYLAPGWTGRGIGRTLLSALVDSCARAGVRQLIAVIAEPGDGASSALHRAFGFAEAGRLTGVGHKHGRWLDTVLLQRDLTGPLAG